MLIQVYHKSKSNINLSSRDILSTVEHNENTNTIKCVYCNEDISLANLFPVDCPHCHTLYTGLPK